MVDVDLWGGLGKFFWVLSLDVRIFCQLGIDLSFVQGQKQKQIKEKKTGVSTNLTNLIVLCPMCRRAMLDLGRDNHYC